MRRRVCVERWGNPCAGRQVRRTTGRCAAGWRALGHGARPRRGVDVRVLSQGLEGVGSDARG
eukprot:2411638-Alexandrium_andersonii.AAC.1